MKKIHIVMISPLSEYGGGKETWLGYFLRQLVEDGQSVSVYCLKNREQGSSLLEQEAFFGVSRFYADRVGVAAFVRQTWFHLKRNFQEGDLCLLLGSVTEGMLAPLMRRRFGRNAAVYIWVRSIGAREIAQGRRKIALPFLSMIAKRNLRLSSGVITNGEDTYRYYTKKNPSLKHKFTCIPNAVDYGKFSAFPIVSAPSCFTLCSVGRITRIKGFYTICSVMDAFDRRYPEYRGKVLCEIWGDGNHTLEKLPENVALKGPAGREEVPAVLGRANAFFFLLEDPDRAAGGLPHSLLEGMASGRLCICTDHPATRQIVTPENGVLVCEGDIDGTVSLLHEIVDAYFSLRYEKYLEISQNAQKSAEACSYENHMRRFYEFTGLKNEETR